MTRPSTPLHRLPLLLAIFALSAALLAGCGSSRPSASANYRQARNEMVYRTRPIDLGALFESGGLGIDPRVSLRGWAACDGENCQPSEAWLSFTLQRGSKEMRVVSDRSVTIKTAEDVYTWQQGDRRNSGNELVQEMRGAPTSGEIARVELDWATLKDIATTQEFRGTIGGKDFSLSYDEREPLRAMMEQMEQMEQTARSPGASS